MLFPKLTVKLNPQCEAPSRGNRESFRRWLGQENCAWLSHYPFVPWWVNDLSSSSGLSERSNSLCFSCSPFTMWFPALWSPQKQEASCLAALSFQYLELNKALFIKKYQPWVLGRWVSLVKSLSIRPQTPSKKARCGGYGSKHSAEEAVRDEPLGSLAQTA